MDNTTSLRLQTLPFDNSRTYLVAGLFIICNIVFPQTLHMIPQGGTTWLPIYFFTLIAAYKYGWKAGLITAIASPVANTVMFGMPAIAGVPAIMLKSVLLAVVAGYAAEKFHKATLWQLLTVVLLYQTAGTLGEWVIKNDFYAACQDFRIGIPGMLLQIFGGWLFINRIIRK